MYPDNSPSVQPSDTIPSPPVDPQRAVVSAGHLLPVKEGEHREVVVASPPSFSDSTIQKASNVAYNIASGLIIVIVAAAFVTLLVWFIGDLRAIGTTPVPAGADRTQFTHGLVVSAAVNLLANLVLVFILIEVFTTIVTFVRTRRATARPLLLIPLYIIMRAIVVIGGQLVFNPPPTNTQLFIEILAELGVFSLVGLALSIGLAVLRDPTPPKGNG